MALVDQSEIACPVLCSARAVRLSVLHLGELFALKPMMNAGAMQLAFSACLRFDILYSPLPTDMVLSSSCGVRGPV